MVKIWKQKKYSRNKCIEIMPGSKGFLNSYSAFSKSDTTTCMNYSYDVFERGGRAADCSLNKREAMLSTELWLSKNNLVLFPFERRAITQLSKGIFINNVTKTVRYLPILSACVTRNLKHEVNPDLPQCWIWFWHDLTSTVWMFGAASRFSWVFVSAVWSKLLWRVRLAGMMGVIRVSANESVVLHRGSRRAAVAAPCGGATHARWVLPTRLQESPSGSLAAFGTCFHRFRFTSVKCNETPREVLAVSWLRVRWPMQGSVNLEPAGSLLSCLSTKADRWKKILNDQRDRSLLHFSPGYSDGK